MYHRQTTPPTASWYFPGSFPNSVGSSVDGFYLNSSPESVATANTTPPRSPIREHGPKLLPKVRTQDQIPEPVAPSGGPVRHRRTTSTSSIGYASTYSPYGRPNPVSRRSSSPYVHPHSNVTSPASVSSYDMLTASTLNSPITFSGAEVRRPSYASHSRSHSASAPRAHFRASSVGSIDEGVLGHFEFPSAYSNFSSYAPVSAPVQPNLSLATALPSAYSQVQDVCQYSTTSTQDFNFTDFSPAPAVQYPVAELGLETPTSSLLDYLTAPNPSPALVRRVSSPPRGVHTHFWWDVRNLRSWTDFNVSTMSGLDSVLDLLQISVPAACLPQPPRTNLQPETQSALQDIHTAYYATKVNAALTVSQGTPHINMRAIKPAAGVRPQPDYISNYDSDYDKTIFGEGRGRVVGLIKCYDQWNTGMRAESPPKQVLYLQGLAHLHRVMREHGCRYGFIMTEIELLCVRCGGPSSASTFDEKTVNAQTGVPLFGYLEVSAPIRLSTHGLHPETGDLQMTAGLALWYLHMLAKEKPFNGITDTWQMEVGGPAALTRQNCREKDAWIPKPNLSEKREAKRVRGWVFPEEPLNKKELGNRKRARSQG
ncbi:hypothetical protein M011DRAFT_423798 [Sporormia fimetaria CBS 119925]|uniref:Sialidase n=1 Tax=Sporormia fimetaria CBS 119925 TaxID=1340428 RepID=A0A6A6VCQ7_9PLEO|nr:hypothetical protein M011DRAFT_423798 [Sporormia fimetaria CBS 119925]